MKKTVAENFLHLIKTTGMRSSMNTKQEHHEEYHTKAHYNRIVKINDKQKILKTDREKRYNMYTGITKKSIISSQTHGR